MSTENPKIHVSGLDFEWDQSKGAFLIHGNASVAMWIESTMAGFMSGIHRMVGTERFNLAVYGAGEDGIEGEWEHLIMKCPTVEEGLTTIGKLANMTGLGYWEVVSIDREKKEARFRSKHSWEAIYQKALGVCWGSQSLSGRFAGYSRKIFGCNVWTEQTAFIAQGAEWDEFIVRASTTTVESRLNELISSDKATRADLDAALGRLKQEIEERKQAEETLKQEIQEREAAQQSLLEKLEIIRSQEEAIRSLSTPILQLWDGIVVLPVIGLVDSMRAAQMLEDLLGTIVRTKARYAILDLTGVEVMDTRAADHLLKVVRASALVGARCLVSGISSNMAQTVVSLGVDLGDLMSFSTLEAALRFALTESAGPREVKKKRLRA
jgi:rsbT co-antagonist protein RsbR